jgi:hypothetical protein
MDANTRQQEVKDFFLLEPPKHTTLETNIRVVIFLGVCYPILKVLFNNDILPLLSWFTIILASYIFYWKPRYEKQKRYNKRITPIKLNNYLLESCKTKILERAIDYLEIDADEMTDQQFIVIPYPVFHKTKNIKDQYILRIKSDIKKEDDKDVEDYFYNYSYWNIQILILSKSYISFYFCGYNWLKDEIINERSNEYFYQDMATIKTETNEVSFLSKWSEEPITEARITKIIHNSGDILNLITEITELKQPPQTIVDIEKIEKTIRILLRHAKTIDESRKPVSIQFKQEPVKEIVLDVE